jgi:hypothetical protein
MKASTKIHALWVSCIGIAVLLLVASYYFDFRSPAAQKITLPDGTTLVVHSISVGERMEKSLGITEYFEVRYSHPPLPGLEDHVRTFLGYPETHSTSPVQIRLRYERPGKWKWDVYLVDGQGIESKARVFGRLDHPERDSEAPNEGWLWIDAYHSRRDFYHLRFRPEQREYDPYEIPSLPLVAEWKVKNTSKVTTPPEKGAHPPLSAQQDRVELVLTNFIRRRQPRQDAAERTSAEFEARHPFKDEMPYVASTNSMTLWDQSGNTMQFNGPVSGFGNRIQLWGRDTFMSDDDCYRVSVTLHRSAALPEVFAADEIFHFSRIPAPGDKDVPVGRSLMVGGRKLTIKQLNATQSGQSSLCLTGDLPAAGEQLVIVDAVDDQGQRIVGIESKSGCQIWPDSATGPDDNPAPQVCFNIKLPQSVRWFNVDFAFDKPAKFEFKVSPKFVD